MKRMLSLISAILLLTACRAPNAPPSPATTTPETTATRETTDAPETTGTPQTTGIPETTGISETTGTPQTTGTPIELPSGEGVWHVATAEELRMLTFGDCALPTVCITAPFALNEPIRFDRPVTLYYLPEQVEPTPAGAGLYIETAESGEIRVISRASALLASGWLTVDAPYCSLFWSGALPEAAAVERWCNLLAYNGERAYGRLGGKGSAKPEGIALRCSSTGEPYADCTFHVRGNVVTFGYPLLASDADVHAATLEFTTTGSVSTATFDLRSPQRVTFTDAEGRSRTYLLEAERLSYQLPLMQLYTVEGAPIEDKQTYVAGTMWIDGVEYPMQIRGRGNASWRTFPKKSYRIKLEQGASLFGLPQNRDWVLVSNYADKSLIRNCVAHTIAGRLDGLDYNPTHIPVNLYLNGEYLGVYTFADKIEEGQGRLSFAPVAGDTPSPFGGLDIGFLCEVGWDFDGENVYNKDYFDAEKVVRIYVKEPKSDRANTPEFTYAKQYILATEQAILQNKDWAAYIDLDSWVDWFILTELTFNTESAFYRSCYFWKREGGRLMLGPVWDFDMAFGNHYGDIRGYAGWCTTESTYTYISENWMNYLMTYPEFTSAVKARWNAVKDDLRTTALAAVDHYEALLDGAQQQNFLRWNIMPYQIGAGSVNAGVYNTHQKQVQYIRDFLINRWAYMDERLNTAY